MSSIAFAQDFVPKTILVTGSNRSLGRTIADQFYEQGYRVIYSGRAGVNNLTENSRRVGITLDISDRASIFTAIDKLYKKGVVVDIVIHNAAMVTAVDIAEQDSVKLSKIMNTNFEGPAVLTAELINRNKLLGKRLHTVYVSSVGAILSKPGFSAYSASKSAAEAFFKVLSSESKASDSTIAPLVHIVRPAIIKSDYTVNLTGSHAYDDVVRSAEVLRSFSPTTSDEVVERIIKIVKNPPAKVLHNIGCKSFISNRICLTNQGPQ